MKTALEVLKDENDGYLGGDYTPTEVVSAMHAFAKQCLEVAAERVILEEDEKIISNIIQELA